MALKAYQPVEAPFRTMEKVEDIREAMHRQMLDSVSHDLKTPLSTIIGSLEIYGRMYEKLTQEKKNILIHTALIEAYRLDNFITNILDMAKLEGDGVNVKRDDCNLTHLINDCLLQLGPKRANCNFTLQHKSGSATVRTDGVLLARALNLVVENAAKHGGKMPVATIAYGTQSGEGFIEVRDHGPGIPQGKEKEIFLKYTRLTKADHQNAGTGLGLAICRQVMKLLGGGIEVKNHKDGGAIFTLRFPAT